METSVFLALGSNLGDREANLQSAIRELPPKVQPGRASPIYETEPWGVTDQPPFLNQVLEAKTTLTAPELLSFLKELEARLGRVASIRYGPRLIDLDILFYGSQTVDTPNLVIPHPRLPERAFVLVPLADLAPDWIHAPSGKTVRDLLAPLDRSGIHPYSI